MKVYLAGPANGCDHHQTHWWRDTLIERLPEIEFVNPLRRDYRGREDTTPPEEIVQADLADIDECDVLIAYCWKASWGTAMEIQYAWRTGKRVIVVVNGSGVSPWLRYHATSIARSLSGGVETLRHWAMV